MEKNELLEMWKDTLRIYSNSGALLAREYWEITKPFWHLKAKMDNMINRNKKLEAIVSFASEIRKGLEKQIIDCFADNATLREKLKKCQEEKGGGR